MPDRCTNPTCLEHWPATVQATTPSTVHGSLTIRTDEPIDPAKEWPGSTPRNASS